MELQPDHAYKRRRGKNPLKGEGKGEEEVIAAESRRSSSGRIFHKRTPEFSVDRRERDWEPKKYVKVNSPEDRM